MKKIMVWLFCLWILSGCTHTVVVDDMEEKENFGAVIEKVAEETILVDPDEDTVEGRGKGLISVSIQTGEHVRIYYDGVILESNPRQIHDTVLIDKA